MLRFLSIILALTMMFGANVSTMPEAQAEQPLTLLAEEVLTEPEAQAQQPLPLLAAADPTGEKEEYSLFISYEGFDDAGIMSHVLSETPYYIIPENPRTIKEGYTFDGYYCKATGKTYQIGDTIPLGDFTSKEDGYHILLSARFTEEEDPNITYTDVNDYIVTLNIVSPIEYENTVYTEEYSFDPSEDTSVGTVSYPGIKQCRQLALYPNKGLSPVGYRSLITGNVFYTGDAYELDRLPDMELTGIDLVETVNAEGKTEGKRIHNYAITDDLVPLYSFMGVEGAFLDPLYDCSINFYVTDPISACNVDDPNMSFGYVGTQKVTGITMDELTADDYFITLDAAPEYAGYKFEGYSKLTETEVTYENGEVSLYEEEFSDDPDGHLRLSVKLHYSIDPNYTPGILKTITYNPNAGSLPFTGRAPADMNEYAIGAPFVVMGPETLAIEGYEFFGWNTEADGSGTMYQENQIAVMTDKAMLYAQWKPEGSVLVTLDGNGGSFDSDTSKNLFAVPGSPLDETEGYEEPTRDGYNFVGWAESPDAEDADVTDAPDADNTTLYAVWSRKNDVKVFFDCNDGTAATSVTGAFEAPLTIPEDPTRTGYSFAGWNTKADGSGTPLTDPAVFPGSDITYYAQWIPDEITVRFLPGEHGKITSDVTEIKLHTGETLSDIEGFTLPDVEADYPYIFVGWRSNGGGFYDPEFEEDLINHVFTGEPNPEIFTAEYIEYGKSEITFYYAGGTDGDGASYKTFTDYEYAQFDDSLVPVPTMPGYTFMGWDADVPDNYPASGEATALNALWSKNEFTVTFDMGGHGNQVDAQIVKNGETAVKPADPKADGYTFAGWFADEAFSAKFDFNSAITEDTTIYAKWTKNSAAPTDPSVPKAGDSVNIWLWVILLAASTVTLIATVIFVRKKNKTNNA